MRTVIFALPEVTWNQNEKHIKPMVTPHLPRVLRLVRDPHDRSEQGQAGDSRES